MIKQILKKLNEDILINSMYNMAKQILDKYNICISVENIQDGACFTIKLHSTPTKHLK